MHDSGQALAEWLRARVAFPRVNRQQSVVRGIFLMGAAVVGIGARIRKWAGTGVESTNQDHLLVSRWWECAICPDPKRRLKYLRAAVERRPPLPVEPSSIPARFSTSVGPQMVNDCGYSEARQQQCGSSEQSPLRGSPDNSVPGARSGPLISTCQNYPCWVSFIMVLVVVFRVRI
jgi:hypothetical protein